MKDLSAAIDEARKKGSPVLKEDLRFQGEDGFREIDLHVVPLKGSFEERRFLVIFVERAAPQTPLAAKAPGTSGDKGQAEMTEKDRRIHALEGELEATRDYLKSVIEELEASNEELKSANEEFQSTNEELQTAKEELESTNEELRTVDDELKDLNEELHLTNDDVYNLLVGIEFPSSCSEETSRSAASPPPPPDSGI